MVARVALLISFPVQMTHVGGAAAADLAGGARFHRWPAHLPDRHAAARRDEPAPRCSVSAKTEMSRGIDLLHSLAGDHAPALSLDRRAFRQPRRNGVAADRSAAACYLLVCASSPGTSRSPCWPAWPFPPPSATPSIRRATSTSRPTCCRAAAMLGAFFIATDYVTSPNTAAGQLVFGAGLRPPDLRHPHLGRLSGRRGLRRAADERADAGHRPLRQAAHPRPRPQGQAAGHSGREGSLT